MLSQNKPKTPRAKRELEKKEPHIVENAKATLFLKGSKVSGILKLAFTDLYLLKEPLAKKFTKSNEIHPFEDASSLEFFSQKNDVSLMVFAIHSKKRPHCLTLVRLFDHKVMEMLELYLDPESFRQISQFKRKAGAGLKPMISFSGTAFESPTPNAYTLAKSLFLDLFKGQDAGSIEVEALQHMIHISVGEEEDGQPPPRIHLRVYRLLTLKSGQKVPRVELEEMGPRMDFRVGRVQQADENVMREAMKRPKETQVKTKKNIEIDTMGDKIGKVHVGKQDLSQLQTRKMKGLKRTRDEIGQEEDISVEENRAKRSTQSE